MLKYVVMGASLSAQGRRHDTGEITGYTEHFIAQADRLSTISSNIQKVTYPGNRLSDAGLIRMTDVLSKNPDICIVEPLVEDSSRGRWATPEEIFFVYESLISNGILPISFLVPLPEHLRVSQFPVYGPVMEISEKFGIPTLIADTKSIIEGGGIFKGVHTTEKSGALLADQLVEFISGIDTRALLKKVRKITPFSPRLVMESYKMPWKPYKKLRIKVKPRCDGHYTLRIIQRQCIGPHSPVLSINLTLQGGGSSISYETSVWDPFCHYERSSYVNLFPQALELEGAASVEIAVSERLPDYTSCRRDVSSWPLPSDLEMRTEGPLNFVSSVGIDVEAAYVG